VLLRSGVGAELDAFNMRKTGLPLLDDVVGGGNAGVIYRLKK